MPPAPPPIEFDDTLWPLLIIRIAGRPTMRDLEAYLDRRLEYMRRPERHVLLYDTSDLRMPSNEMNQRHVAWLKEHDALIQEKVVATSVIITSPLVRLTASAMAHFWRSRVPYHITANLPEAARWAADRLHDAGYPVQANLIRQRFRAGTGPHWRKGP
jgi:hypothetical protein